MSATPVSIELDGLALDNLVRLHGAALKQVKQAEKRALKKLSRWVGSRMVRRFADAAKVPRKVAKGRIRSELEDDGSIHVWIGLDGVAAHRAGRLSGGRNRRSAGVKVSSRQGGQMFFRGAFQAKIYGGGQRVFIRKYSKHFDKDLYPIWFPGSGKLPQDPELQGRFPVVVARLSIAEAVEAAIYRDEPAINKKMLELFEHELKVALGIIETSRGRV